MRVIQSMDTHNRAARWQARLAPIDPDGARSYPPRSRLCKAFSGSQRGELCANSNKRTGATFTTDSAVEKVARCSDHLPKVEGSPLSGEDAAAATEMPRLSNFYYGSVMFLPQQPGSRYSGGQRLLRIDAIRVALR